MQQPALKNPTERWPLPLRATEAPARAAGQREDRGIVSSLCLEGSQAVPEGFALSQRRFLPVPKSTATPEASGMQQAAEKEPTDLMNEG